MLWVILVVILAGAGLLSEQLQRSDNRRQGVDVLALAHNLLIYRNALAEYAYNNPDIAGARAHSARALLTWRVHAAGVSGYVQARSSYAYYATPPMAWSQRSPNSLNPQQWFTPRTGTSSVLRPG
ncbi:type IV pilus biogenesis protein PilM [Pseudomonas oryzihabitans]|uniref:type IV pilus biogenesis protein PilM n=1 Tax=Pseudomonas oryzihabitans TaxID=47885 RepID=UPI0021C34C99|nr:type IV pilus biogenesis protein PilM [Pseudomonas oryzihabitans]